MDNPKKYKIRKLNILDIRTIAKILKEANLTRKEVRESIEGFLISSRDITSTNDSQKDYSKHIKDLLPLVDILLDILADSDTFWDFIADITGEDLTDISLTDVRYIIKDLFKDKELISFFTTASTQTRSLMQ